MNISIAIDRKNYLVLVRRQRRCSAALYSVIESAKLNGLNPQL